ncbi:MAG: TerB family tellurite resistance protein [Polyangiaceae bacterium]
MTITIQPRTIERLRDTLRDSGQREAQVVSPAFETLARAGLLSESEKAAVKQIQPLAEIMYLTMAADGVVLEIERDVMRGAIIGLSNGEINAGTVTVLLEGFAKNLTHASRDERLTEVCDALKKDVAGAEGAFVLSAAIAFADDAIVEEEQEFINKLAGMLGISENRAQQLLNELGADKTVEEENTAQDALDALDK